MRHSNPPASRHEVSASIRLGSAQFSLPPHNARTEECVASGALTYTISTQTRQTDTNTHTHTDTRANWRGEVCLFSS